MALGSSDARLGMTEMEGSLPDLRLQVAALLDGKIDLNHFQTWLAMSETAIELDGSDADLDQFDRVSNLLAEYTGDHISATELLDALRVEFPEQTPALAISRLSGT